MLSLNDTRGELEPERAMVMVGVRGDGVLVLVETWDKDGVGGAGDGVRVTVMYS
jgi:hypothetical protein